MLGAVSNSHGLHAFKGYTIFYIKADNNLVFVVTADLLCFSWFKGL